MVAPRAIPSQPDTVVSVIVGLAMLLAPVAAVVSTASIARAAPPVCGDFVVDPAAEDCDPPGTVSCPPGSAAGAFLACADDCRCPSDFQCYRVKRPAPFLRSGVTLADRVWTNAAATIGDARSLCVPASRDGARPDVLDRPDDLMSYDVTAPPFTRVSDVRVDDDFGTLVVDVIKPKQLLVPTSHGTSGTSPPPLSDPLLLDHSKELDTQLNGLDSYKPNRALLKNYIAKRGRPRADDGSPTWKDPIVKSIVSVGQTPIDSQIVKIRIRTHTTIFRHGRVAFYALKWGSLPVPKGLPAP